MAKKMKWYDYASISLLISGALNWGSVGLFAYNFVDAIASTYAKYVYILVGIAGLYSLYWLIWGKK